MSHLRLYRGGQLPSDRGSTPSFGHPSGDRGKEGRVGDPEEDSRPGGAARVGGWKEAGLQTLARMACAHTTGWPGLGTPEGSEESPGPKGQSV